MRFTPALREREKERERASYSPLSYFFDLLKSDWEIIIMSTGGCGGGGEREGGGRRPLEMPWLDKAENRITFPMTKRSIDRNLAE